MKIIAVWGSSGAGKTALSLALAAELAKRKQEVLVIGADNGIPALPVYLPLSDFTPMASMGGVLEGAATEAALKGRLHKHPKSDRIFFLGHVSGEMPVMNYKVPQRGAIESLFQVLQGSPFQFCIVDCATSPAFDPLTLCALEAAQQVVRVTTPDVKGWEWQKAQIGWLQNNDAFAVERHIKVCNPVFSVTPMAEVQALFGGFDLTMPYALQVAERMTAGDLLSGFSDPQGIAFSAQAATLAGMLDRLQEVTPDAC